MEEEDEDGTEANRSGGFDNGVCCLQVVLFRHERAVVGELRRDLQAAEALALSAQNSM